MKTLFKFLPILAISLLLSACHKDEDDTEIPSGAETRTLIGRIIDGEGKPMQGVSVEMYCNIQKGSFMQAITERLKAKAETDAQGIYRLSFYRQEDEKSYPEKDGIYASYTVSVAGLCGSHFCGSTANYYDLDEFWQKEITQIEDFKLYKKRNLEVKILSAPEGFEKGSLRVVFEESAGGQTGSSTSFETVPSQLSVAVPVGQTVKLICVWSEDKKETTEVKIGETEPTVVELGK